jgi:diguanylate cyclase (GGDEF)-like protein/PAS domain S-box-containing protein
MHLPAQPAVASSILTPSRIAAVYALFASVWILVSGDVVSHISTDVAWLNEVEKFKGLAFVLVTSALLYALLSRWYRVQDALRRRVAATNASLEESQRRLMDAQAMAQVGSWHVELGAQEKDDVWNVSDELRVLFGVDAHAPPSMALGISRMAPEDQAVARELWAQTRMGTGPAQWEHRVVVDGQIRWVRVQTEYQRDAQGRMISITGTNQDITERKRVEQELRIAATAFETQEAMFITDAHQTIIKTNKAFTEITGFRAEEAIGRKPSLLGSGRHNEIFYQAMWADIGRSNCWRGEIWNRRKNGEVYPEWLSITKVTSDDGIVTNYVAAFSDISQRKQAEETIYSLAFYDTLTSLPNRKLLRDRLQQSLLLGKRTGHCGAVLFIDLDDFKSLNDTQGHAAGDALLIEVAGRIRNCVHTDDTIARLGSDEFVVVLDSLSTDADLAAEQAKLVAERVHARICEPVNLSGQDYRCKSCIGVSLFGASDSTVDELLKQADSAMSQGKQSGRNKVHFFDAQMQAALEARVQLEYWLQLAVPDQLMLYYQAQTDASGHIFGAEALIRWQHPQKGLISPASFIPLAESSGLILPIGHWVIATACRQLKLWEKDVKTRHLVLSVNVSARQFQHPQFVHEVEQTLQETGADPGLLKLELTESMLAENVDAMVAKMQQLRDRGVHFSLDDFGTGFSSLNYLKRLPIDQLKIDQSFVKDVLEDANDAAIVRSVIALGQSLGLAVIAEGVETPGQRDFLAVHGCAQFQGYLFGRPVPLADFERHLQAS